MARGRWPCPGRSGSRGRRRSRPPRRSAACPASNLSGQLGRREAVEADVGDHVAAAEERRHGVEQLLAAPQHADARSARTACGTRRPGSRRPSPARRSGRGARTGRRRRWRAAPAAWAASASRRTGLMVPSTLDMAVKANALAPSSSRSRSVRSSWPSSVSGTQRSSMPRSAARMCHGTMLAWCSICVSTTTSPAAQVGAAPGVGDQVEALGGVLGEDQLVGVRGVDEALRLRRGRPRRPRWPRRPAGRRCGGWARTTVS